MTVNYEWHPTEYHDSHGGDYCEWSCDVDGGSLIATEERVAFGGTRQQSWWWSVMIAHETMGGPGYYDPPDLVTDYETEGRGYDLADAKFQAIRAYERFLVLDQVLRDEEDAYFAKLCECNGGPPCDCPDCDHPDCSYKL